MGKTIVFCADGTWNGPGPHAAGAGHAPELPTNVFDFFRLLAPTNPSEPSLAPEQEKTVSEGNRVVQVAKYLHGVGHSDNWLTKMLGGAVGTGTISRIVRGYTFLSRHYQPGDRIVLIGFSRGAYTVRALAGLIAARGLLPPSMPAGDPTAYSLGVRVWQAHRAETAPEATERFCALMTGLLTNIFEPAMPDLVPVDCIGTVAVWDTVGALGIPVYDNDGGRRDAFQFTNTALSPKVRLGLHAVSIDDLRADFTPTLWDPDPSRILQVLFPGAHADVGGGYERDAVATQGRLADCALVWMVDELEHAGLGLRFGDAAAVPAFPYALAAAHDEQVVWPYRDRAPKLRTFPATQMFLSEAAAQRWDHKVTTIPMDKSEPRVGPYRPTNLIAFTNGDHPAPGSVHLAPSQRQSATAIAV